MTDPLYFSCSSENIRKSLHSLLKMGPAHPKLRYTAYRCLKHKYRQLVANQNFSTNISLIANEM